jgi:hypothetical protein
MAFEYTVWAKSAVWQGEIEEADYPPFRLSTFLFRLLEAEAPPPPFMGSVRKKFDSFLNGLFFDFKNTLLSPDDARQTAAWLRAWAAGDTEHERETLGAYNCADWLETAANQGWYVDWSI